MIQSYSPRNMLKCRWLGFCVVNTKNARFSTKCGFNSHIRWSSIRSFSFMGPPCLDIDDKENTRKICRLQFQFTFIMTILTRQIIFLGAYYHDRFNLLFLAATKQLYEWFSPSLPGPSVCLHFCPSVTPFWQCCSHPNIMKISEAITIDKSDVRAKGPWGQRSNVEVTEVKTQFWRFRTVTPVWIHMVTSTVYWCIASKLKAARNLYWMSNMFLWVEIFLFFVCYHVFPKRHSQLDYELNDL